MTPEEPDDRVSGKTVTETNEQAGVRKRALRVRATKVAEDAERIQGFIESGAKMSSDLAASRLAQIHAYATLSLALSKLAES